VDAFILSLIRAMATGTISAGARERHGPFKLAILPIWCLRAALVYARPSHEPVEAVQALIDCGGEVVALAHHHSTFQLTDEPIDAPLLALMDALNVACISPGRAAWTGMATLICLIARSGCILRSCA
jgi:hypothetical protein